MIEVSKDGIMFRDSKGRSAWVDMPLNGGMIHDIVHTTIHEQRTLLRDAAINLAGEMTYHAGIVEDPFMCIMEALGCPWDGEPNTHTAAAEAVKL